jgi:hypothetical protein
MHPLSPFSDAGAHPEYGFSHKNIAQNVRNASSESG